MVQLNHQMRLSRDACHFVAQGHSTGIGRQFLQEQVIGREFILRVFFCLIGIGHQQSNLGTLDGLGKRTQEFLAQNNDRIVLPITGVALNQFGMKRRQGFALGKLLINSRNQLSGLGPMEIWNGALLFFGVAPLRRGCIQNQREDAVKIARAGIHSADVAKHGKIAGPEIELLLGRIQQNIGQAAEGFFRGIRHFFAVIEGEVVTRGLRIGIRIQ